MCAPTDAAGSDDIAEPEGLGASAEPDVPGGIGRDDGLGAIAGPEAPVRQAAQGPKTITQIAMDQMLEAATVDVMGRQKRMWGGAQARQLCWQ